MPLNSGSLLNNRYRIIEILGQGGMGSIYKAEDENLGVDVAVKENSFTTEEYARQFRLEAVILANLRHVNLPRVSDHFVIDGQGQYLVMDYIMGEDLREQMDRDGQIAEDVILDIGICICDALSYMHSRKPPVLHRDIKPGNVRITPSGEIFLVDFGLAKFVQKDQETSTGARAMTPGYSPPEQYGGAHTDNRSDIYSLGATMYAALVGNIPEDSLARTMNQAKLTSIRKRNKQISKLTAAAVEKALEVNPSDRYQDAEKFKQDLVLARKSLSGGDLAITSDDSQSQDGQSDKVIFEQEKPSGVDSDLSSQSNSILDKQLKSKNRKDPWITSFPWISNHRKIIFSILSAMIFLIFGVILINVVNPNLINFNVNLATPSGTIYTDSSLTPVMKTEVPLIESGKTHYPSTTSIQTYSTTPDAPLLTSNSSSRLTSTPTTSVPIVASPSSDEVIPPEPTTTGGGAGQIAFSSDRTGLPQIWIINVDGTGLKQITEVQGGACQPDWSPDGQKLVFTSPCDGDYETYQGSGLSIIDADGSNLTPLPIQGLGDYDPKWSPDGTKIAFTSLKKSDRPQILVWDLPDQTVQTLSMEDFRDIQPSWSANGSIIVFVSTRNGPYQIWTMNSDGSNQLRISVSGSLKDTKPVFSPDNRNLVFNQSKGPGSIPHLQGAQFPDGVAQEYLISNAGIKPMKDADFSSDGLWIVIESWPDGSMHDIYLMAFTGGDFIQLTTDPSLDFDPAWRPDGQ